MKNLLLVGVGITFCLLYSVIAGLNVTFTISPNETNSITHEDVKLECVANGVNSSLTDIQYITVYKGNNTTPLAMLYRHKDTILQNAWTHPIKVSSTGNMNTTGLTVYISDPSPDMEGLYTCTVDYIYNGTWRTDTGAASLKVLDIDMNDVAETVRLFKKMMKLKNMPKDFLRTEKEKKQKQKKNDNNNNGCPDNTWKRHKNICFKTWSKNTTDTTWTHAQKMCKINGGNLAQIYRKETNEFLLEQIRDTGFNHWIGYTDEHSDGLYHWDGGMPEHFKNWADNQPDDFPPKSDCVFINANDGKWWNAPCHWKLPFICEKTLQPRDI